VVFVLGRSLSLGTEGVRIFGDDMTWRFTKKKYIYTFGPPKKSMKYEGFRLLTKSMGYRTYNP